MWFNRDGISNILSMENVTNKHPISYDSSAGDKFILKKSRENSFLIGANQAYSSMITGLATFSWSERQRNVVRATPAVKLRQILRPDQG